MGASELLRDALFGNPPSPTRQPSREGVLAAVGVLQDAVTAVGFADGIFDTTASGLAATTDGELFLVKGATSEAFADLYKNVSGAAVSQGISLPSSAAIALKASLSDLLAETTRAKGVETGLEANKLDKSAFTAFAVDQIAKNARTFLAPIGESGGVVPPLPNRGGKLALFDFDGNIQAISILDVSGGDVNDDGIWHAEDDIIEDGEWG